jgi:hypothetical protein
MSNMKKVVLAGFGMLVSVATSFSAPSPGGGVSPEFQALYQRALLTGGTNETVRKQLDVAIGKGTLEMIGPLYLMRGNLFLKAGDEEAALSDFLKVTTLFQKNKAIQPEALFQAATLLDAVRDPRGADLRKSLIRDYPGNEFALKAAAAPKLSGPSASPAPVKKP